MIVAVVIGIVMCIHPYITRCNRGSLYNTKFNKTRNVTGFVFCWAALMGKKLIAA